MKRWWAGLVLFNAIMGISLLYIGVAIMVYAFGFMGSDGNPLIALLLSVTYLGILIFVNRWLMSKLANQVVGLLLAGVIFIISPYLAYLGNEWYDKNGYRWEFDWHPKVEQLMEQAEQLPSGIEFLDIRSNGYTVGNYPLPFSFQDKESTLRLAFVWDETIQPFTQESFQKLTQWVGEPDAIVDYTIEIDSLELYIRNEKGKLLCRTPANEAEKDYCAPLGITNQLTYSPHVVLIQEKSKQLPQGVIFRKGYSEERFAQIKEEVYAFIVPKTFSATELKKILEIIPSPKEKWAMEFQMAGSEYSWIRLELNEKKITGCSSPNDKNFTCETIGLKAWQLGEN